MLGHNVSIGKFKKIEIITSIFSDQSTMRLEINYINNMLLNNLWITEQIKVELKKYIETNESESMTV